VENWVNEWGLRVANKVGVGTRYDKRGGVWRVLDLVVCGGGFEASCKLGEGVVGMDHRPLEVEIEADGSRVEDIGWKKGGVDWEKFKCELRVWRGEGIGLLEGKVQRRDLEEVVEDLELGLKLRLERCKGRKKWESGRKRW